MGPKFQDRSGKAPRSDYRPRELITDRRAFAKWLNTAPTEKDESLPTGWNILWPNRIRQIRLSRGIETTSVLALKTGHIGYQRLCCLERGIKVGRDSELELLAAALDCRTSDLILPPLSRSETVQWMETWSTKHTIGGDHHSVLLSAYYRLLIARTGVSRNKVTDLARINGFKASFTNLFALWHAEKPVDRYADQTMDFVMFLACASSWEAVIDQSRVAYRTGQTQRHIEDLQKPRVRYAPEDPDRRAPWTFVTDPFRPTISRRVHLTAFSTEPGEGKTDACIRLKREKKETRFAQTTAICRQASEFAAATTLPQERMLRLFPHDRESALLLTKKLKPASLRKAILRARLVQLSERHDLDSKIVADTLEMTRERFNQLRKKGSKSVATTGLTGSILGAAS